MKILTKEEEQEHYKYEARDLTNGTSTNDSPVLPSREAQWAVQPVWQQAH